MPLFPNARPSVVFVFFALLLDVMSLGIIIPILPMLLTQMVSGDTAQAAYWYGLFALMWSVIQFFAAPFWGVLSDRFGRRPIILISCFGLAVDHVLTALAPSILLLLVARAFSALFSANFSAINAYASDISTPERRAKIYGIIGAAWGTGFVLGPALGGMLGNVDVRWPFWLAASLTFLNALYGLFILPESLKMENRRPFTWKRANPFGSLQLLRHHRPLWPLMSINALYFISHYALTSVFVLYTSYRYHWNAHQVGLALTYTGILNVLVQGVLVSRIVKKLGEIKSLTIGLCAASIGFFLFASASTPTMFYVGMTVFSLIGLTTPALQSLMTQTVGPQDQGALQGTSGSVNAMCGFFAPVIFTTLFGHSLNVLPGAPYYVSAFLCLVGIVIAWRIAPQKIA